LTESKNIQNVLLDLSKNDENAFRQIFHLFSDSVYSFSLRLTRSKIDAEEIVQEVFLKIWTGRASAHTIENFSAYLFIITKNLALNVIKRRVIEEKANIAFVNESPNTHCQTEETVIYRDYERLLKDMVKNLPPQQQLIYSMCRQEGLQYEEVAQRLKISKLTVKTHMQQAIKTIKTQFIHILRFGLLLAPVVF
jgi:RNA polymerase sigma-70 factor (family 1)